MGHGSAAGLAGFSCPRSANAADGFLGLIGSTWCLQTSGCGRLKTCSGTLSLWLQEAVADGRVEVRCIDTYFHTSGLAYQVSGQTMESGTAPNDAFDAVWWVRQSGGNRTGALGWPACRTERNKAPTRSDLAKSEFEVATRYKVWRRG